MLQNLKKLMDFNEKSYLDGKPAENIFYVQVFVKQHQ